MTLRYDLITKSSMPERFKLALQECMQYIEAEAPSGLVQVLLFGSVARSSIHPKSDIDLCLVFEDGVEMYSREMRIFRSMLRGTPMLMDADVVTCTVSQLASNSCLLYREINKDKVVLSD